MERSRTSFNKTDFLQQSVSIPAFVVNESWSYTHASHRRDCKENKNSEDSDSLGQNFQSYIYDRNFQRNQALEDVSVGGPVNNCIESESKVGPEEDEGLNQIHNYGQKKTDSDFIEYPLMNGKPCMLKTQKTSPLPTDSKARGKASYPEKHLIDTNKEMWGMRNESNATSPHRDQPALQEHNLHYHHHQQQQEQQQHHQHNNSINSLSSCNGVLKSEQEQENNLMIQLQADLLDAIRQKEAAFLEIKDLQEKLKASEKTVKKLTKKLDKLGQTVVINSQRRSSRKKKKSRKILQNFESSHSRVYDYELSGIEDSSFSVEGTNDEDNGDDEDIDDNDIDSNMKHINYNGSCVSSDEKKLEDKTNHVEEYCARSIRKKRRILPKDENGEKIRPKCPVCAKLCWNYSRLDQHMYLHTGEKPHKCTVCDKSFRLKFQLEQHFRIHKEDKPFTCSICGKGYNANSVLWVHMRTHTGERTFQCSICPKTFLQSAHLTQHMRTHTGQKPFQCSICSKSFKQKAHLVLHERVHSGEKPFQCYTCGRGFMGSSHLTRHMKIHTGEKSHVCRYCSKAFSEGSYLTRHLTVHTGEKPHHCSICDKTFRVKYNLTQHMRVHNKRRNNNEIAR